MLGLNNHLVIGKFSGFKETSSHTATYSKNKFVPSSIKYKNVGALGWKSTVQYRFPQPKVQNLRPRINPKFIPTCHNCGELSHIKPRCRESFLRKMSRVQTSGMW